MVSEIASDGIGTADGTGNGTGHFEPVSENRDKSNKQIKERKNMRSSEVPGQGEWQFAIWYAAYPRRRKPKDAERAFAKVRNSGEITFGELMAATKRYVDAVSKKRIESEFIPYPASWLNGGSYLDEDDVAPTTTAGGDTVAVASPTRDPKTFTESEWRDRLAHTGQWLNQHWGPPPGCPGCLVPSVLLTGYGMKDAA